MVTAAECDEDADIFMGVFGGYTYLNLSVTRVVAVRTPGMSLTDADAPFLGSEDLAPDHVPDRRDRNLLATLRGLRYAWSVLASPDLPALDDAVAEIDMWRAGLTPVDEATDDELFGDTVGMLPMVSRIFALHLAITGGAGIGLDALRRTAGRRGEDLMALLGGLGEVDSAAPSDALWILGRLVRESPELTVHFEDGLAGLEERLRDDPAAAVFLDAFDDFLGLHGARGPNEWEMGCEVWGTNPALPLALIDRMRGAADDHAPGTRGARWAADREQAVAVARRRVRPHERWLFDRGLRCTVLRTRGRERCKTILVEAIHEGRLRLQELGRRLADRHPGVAPNDLLYVTLDEFASYRSDPDAFVVTVAERRAIREQLLGLEPPFCFEGELPPVDQWHGATPRDGFGGSARAIAGQVLTGTGGSPGVARGRARVVLDPSDPGDLGSGDVLVAPLTDPSWTPLFVPVEAVVVDVGGQMSHAVIVSRELGLPCVVAVTGATTMIADGTPIEVDGAAGTVRILD